MTFFHRLRFYLHFCLLLCLVPMLPTVATAEARVLKAYFFGNSLIHHADGLPATSMPYWLNQIARSRGGGLRADGSWGFLLNHADRLPPDPNWQIGGVRSTWSRRLGTLSDAGVEAVVINPANFLQYQAPTARIGGPNPEGLSPVSATLKVFDWASQGAVKPQLYVYEGWNDMGGAIKGFPPSAAEYRSYLKSNQGNYHRWYEGYVKTLRKDRPNLRIQLIPVADRLADVLQMPELAGVQPTDLFTDDAPHGTATVYFLAALISYPYLYQDDLPQQMTLPRNIHPLVKQNYRQIAALVMNKGAARNDAGMAEKPDKPNKRANAAADPETAADRSASADQATSKRPPILPQRPVPVPEVPAMAMGLNGISDWTTQAPFIDVMKTARPWIGHRTGEWGGWDDQRLQAEGYLGADGWPLRMPKDVEKIEAFVLTDLPEDAAHSAGRYRLRYQGQGDLTLIGRAENIDARPGEIWFDFTPGEGLVALSISALDPSDPIRDIEIIHERHIPFYTLGERFNPDWLARVQHLRVVRFMDWMFTNNSTVTSWDERALTDDYSYQWRGVPVEVMLDLANRIGADPWFNMPHAADDTYMRQFAKATAAGLDPGLKAYVEYSNEVWNFIFGQADYAKSQAKARWGRDDSDLWLQWTGLRAAEMAQIWTSAFEDAFGDSAADRLVRVIATHTAWPGLEEALLDAPRARGIRPADHFDAYAVTGYFGYELGEADMAENVMRWLAISESEALKRSHKWLRDGPVAKLNDTLFPYHAKVAARYDMDLIMYEGGTHIVGHDAWINDETLTEFFVKLNYSAEVAALYADVIDGWRAAGGTLFNAFVDVSKPSKWGSWGALRHLSDDNPRWDTLMQANARLKPDWDPRTADVFRRGQALAGTLDDDLLEGSPYADTLVGYEGADWFWGRGGADAFHGGDGDDTVLLPGAPDDYQISWAGDYLLADGPWGQVMMLSIENIAFSTDPNQSYTVSPRS